MKNLKNNPLTRFNEKTGHYDLEPQRGCFLRCRECVNLREADSQKTNDRWFFVAECEFCVQRVIDLLGYYEHGTTPHLIMSGRKKDRMAEEDGSIYAAIMRSVEAMKERDKLKQNEPRSDVFDDCVGGDT